MLDYFDNFKIAYYRNKGQKLLVNGLPEKAFAYLEKALMLDLSAPNIYNIALVFLTLGNLEEAKFYLKKICEMHPGNELAVLTLAELYMQKRDWEGAEAILKRLTEEHPSNQSYKKYYSRVANPLSRESYIKAKEMLNQAQLYLQQKNTCKALELLISSEKLDPENPYIKNNLGSYYLMLEGNPRKAFEYFQKAHEIDPVNMKFRQNLNIARKRVAKLS